MNPSPQVHTPYSGENSMIEMSETSRFCSRVLTIALFAVTCPSLTGCTASAPTSSTQSSVSASPPAAPTEWKIDHANWNELGYEWRWTGFPPLQPGASIDHATAYEDLLVFQGSGSTLSVLESSTGKVRWSRQVDRPTTRFEESVRRDDTLYTASDTDLWELDLRNGNTIDRDALGTLVNTSPLLVNNLAIFGTSAGELFAWEMNNDFKLWSYKFDGPINVPAVKVNDDYIAALSENGELRTLQTINAHSGMSAKIAGGSDATLLTDGEGIYIASKDQSLYAFDIEDGYRFWRIRSSAPITVQHTLYDGVVYATTDDLGLSAIDTATGKIIWKNEKIGGWALTVVDGNKLIVWSGYELFAIDKDRGDIIARMPLKNIAGIRTDSITNGNIFVVTLDGTVAKFGLK